MLDLTLTEYIGRATNRVRMSGRDILTKTQNCVGNIRITLLKDAAYKNKT